MNKNSISWLNLVFENRNKSYGAYELRYYYEDRLLKSLAIALFIILLLFITPFALTRLLKHAEAAKILGKEEITYVSQKFEIERVNVLPPLEKPTVIKQVAVSHPIVSDAYQITKSIEPKQSIEVKQIEQPSATASTDVSGTAEPHAQTVVTAEPNNLPDIDAPMSAATVDVAPAFPGGDEAMQKYLLKNIRYSDIAREMHINGRIFACFTVNEKGVIENVQLKNSLFRDLDNEVVRVVNGMPLWSPGIYRGKKVKTILILPLKFELR